MPGPSSRQPTGKPREFNWLIGMRPAGRHAGAVIHRLSAPWTKLALLGQHDRAIIAQSPREITDAFGNYGFFDPGEAQVFCCSAQRWVGLWLSFVLLLHVMILPWRLAGLMAVHFWRIRKDGGWHVRGCR